MKYSYGIFWVLIMGIAGYLTWFSIANQPDGNIEYNKPKIHDKKIGSISARTTRLEEVGEDGTIHWILESVDLNGTVEGSFTMSEPRAQIIVQDETTLTMTAPEGSYNNSDKSVHLTGGVEVIRGDDNSTFWADEIIFLSKEKQLQSGGGDIKLSRGNWEFHASQFSLDLSTKNPEINLTKPVRLVGYQESE